MNYQSVIERYQQRDAKYFAASRWLRLHAEYKPERNGVKVLYAESDFERFEEQYKNNLTFELVTECLDEPKTLEEVLDTLALKGCFPEYSAARRFLWKHARQGRIKQRDSAGRVVYSR